MLKMKKSIRVAVGTSVTMGSLLALMSGYLERAIYEDGTGSGMAMTAASAALVLTASGSGLWSYRQIHPPWRVGHIVFRWIIQVLSLTAAAVTVVFILVFALNLVALLTEAIRGNPIFSEMMTAASLLAGIMAGAYLAIELQRTGGPAGRVLNPTETGGMLKGKIEMNSSEAVPNARAEQAAEDLIRDNPADAPVKIKSETSRPFVPKMPENAFEGLRGAFGSLIHTVGERAVDLVVQTAAMIMTERAYGPEALGIYAYLTALYLIAANFAEFGISRWVEHETGSETADRERLLQDGLAACAFTGIIALVGFLTFDLWATGLSRIEERAAAYFLIGMAVLVKNLNGVQTGFLHGSGRHTDASRINRRKKLIFLGALWGLLIVRVPPSWLIAAFVLSESAAFCMIRRKIPFPRPGILWEARSRLQKTLAKGRTYLFTDDTLDIVLYTDFLILGLYVSAGDLGAYAQALILVRFFLIVPFGMQPILRRRYLSWAAQKSLGDASDRIDGGTRLLFAWHGVLALYLLAFFTQVAHGLLGSDYHLAVSFQCFELILPGLMLFAPIVAQEPYYEALGRVEAYRRLVFGIGVINLVLNIYLVPFAGIMGASAATSLSMTAYFLVFGHGLRKKIPWHRGRFFIAGAAVYLTFAIDRSIELWGVLRFIVLPAGFFLLLWLTGFISSSTILNPLTGKGDV